MKENATKKLPVSLRADGKAGLRAEHLIPCLETPRQDIFIGIKTKKTFTKGMLTYLGCEVSVDNILEKIKLPDDAVEKARPVLESFLEELQAFKIGNVVSVSFSQADKCILKKLAEHPPFEKRKGKLP